MRVLILTFGALAMLTAPALGAGDTEPPTTATVPDGIPGENGWFRSDVEVRLVCTDNLQCGSTQYSVDGSVFAAYGDPFPVSGEGIHTVLASSQDTTGNIEPVTTLEVRIDHTLPSASLDDPAAGSVSVNDMVLPLPALPVTLIVGDKTVLASMSDALSGAGRVEFVVDGVVRANDAESPFAWLWPSSEESLGGHTLQINAYDIAGNVVSQGLEVIVVPTTAEGLQATLD
ncbi:MAG TPA: Ig-like domain-containing protein [Candidatus Thermoplasmatota archaeon]|jgi:hypothetical protein|nr:Ig-like domain-containing protein [Candidatus Thermoplasmatota archaeon]